MKQHSFQLIVIIGGSAKHLSKERFDKLAEGVGTMAALMVLSQGYY